MRLRYLRNRDAMNQMAAYVLSAGLFVALFNLLGWAASSHVALPLVKNDLLARKVGYVSIHGSSSFRAAMKVLRQGKITVEWGHSGHEAKYARIDLELRNVTVREALDAIAKADGQVTWSFVPIDIEKRIAQFNLISQRTSGITEFDEEMESCPMITRWRLKLKLKWDIGSPVDMTDCKLPSQIPADN